MTIILELEGLPDPDPGGPGNPLPSNASVFKSTAVEKITKRRRKFNLNVSSIQAGMEEESETQFFDRLVGGSPEGPGTMSGVMLDLDGKVVEDKASGNRGFQSESDDSKDRRDIRELQYGLRDVMEAVDEQQRLQVRAQLTDQRAHRVNLPRHGQYCEAFDGQFIHVDSDGLGGFTAISHGLGRVPQGAIATRNGREAEIIPEGVAGNDPPIPPATEKVVYARHFGGAGDSSVFILF